MHLNNTTDREEALQKELAVKYRLAGIATYVESTGGNVVEAKVSGLNATLVVEDSHPYFGFTQQELGRVDPESVLRPEIRRELPNSIEVLATAIAQIGAEAASWWATREAPWQISAIELPPSAGFGSAWHGDLSKFFAERLGMKVDSRRWSELVELIYLDSRETLMRNWYSVENYRSQLEEHGEIRRSTAGRDYFFQNPINEEKVRFMWEDGSFLTSLPSIVY